MTSRRVLPIVEGHGDAAALPTLIRRIAQEQGIYDLKILRPHVRGDYPKLGARLQDYLLAAHEEGAPALWVLDYDCKACNNVERDLEDLRRKSQALAPQLMIRFAFIVKEYESLFLTNEAATRKVLKHIPAEITFPDEPEGIRGAKEWLSKALPKGLAYKETIHQEKISAHLDLPLLRQRSPSFQRLEQALIDLIKN